MFSQGDQRSVSHRFCSLNHSVSSLILCFSPESFSLSILFFGLQLFSAFASHRTAGKKSSRELVKDREGGETKGAFPPKKQESTRKRRFWYPGLSMGMPTDGFPPHPSGSAALHHFSESLWRQRHERELWVKGRDEGSGLLCPWPHIAFVPLLSPEAGTFCSPCHSRLSFCMTASHLRHHLIYISNCHQPALD